MLALLLLDALLTYGVALSYSNRVHDNDLSDDAQTLAEMLRTDPGGPLSAQARFLLEYDPDGPNYFAIVSRMHGLLSGHSRLRGLSTLAPNAPPVLYDTFHGRRPVRAATVSFDSPREPGDTITVTVAETLQDRHQRAREILLLTVPLQTLLILSVLALVWFGVNHGLLVLRPLTRRLAAREHELAPITAADVPREILPLTRTIDALFARLRGVLTLQERFIADAAHQLRTPLAGLRLHTERALAAKDADTQKEALDYIRQLTQRVTRTSTQLLALTRAQSPHKTPDNHVPLELSRLVPEAVGLRVHEALRAGIDLGYIGPEQPLHVMGDAAALQELLDNLIDNALRYAGRGSTVTVGLVAAEDGVELYVEDNGPGVPEELLSRLGERFFRAPGNREDGTGLGLAIVHEIAAGHGAEVHYGRGSEGGLRVALKFPAPPKTS
ncbi:sensor histidine kinase [Frateuria defendens]|uniref:sensor histidine kinase n=1 Tax=Frateuria defendens TaxID=2219559 RepID=UPI0009E60CB6